MLFRSANFLKSFIALPVNIGNIASFLVIIIFIVLLFRLVGQGWLLILKTEAKAGFSQWVGGIFGFLSSLMICSLLFFGMLLIGNPTLNRFIGHSITGHYLVDLSPNIYKGTFNTLIVPFFPDEAYNLDVVDVVNQVPASK